MEKENIVIGIEGTVGAGKTSICKKILKEIENSIIIHGGDIYRGIVYGMLKADRTKTNEDNIDAFEMMNKLGIEVRLEERETVIYMNGEKIKEEDLQSKEASIAVSSVSNVANNKKLYEFGKKIIDKYRKDYNVILSSRDIIKMYPDCTYHFFITASLEERTKRKYMQYNKQIPQEQVKEMIEKRDKLQEQSGYYKIYPQTKVIDVTNCKTVEEATQEVLKNMKELD
ncbi:MAG: hypothetical protein HFJ55_04105 [Clostridia bacterium]|nr:hypothetical protein [Clostridia bacterium]